VGRGPRRGGRRGRRPSRAARSPPTIAAPGPPSSRRAGGFGPRTRAVTAPACAPSITAGADRAVPISSASRPTADGRPCQNGRSKARRRRSASARPQAPVASWAAETTTRTRSSSMAGQLTPGHGRGAGATGWDAVWMTELTIAAPRARLPVYVAVPDGPGPWPGVVVIHDGMGMGQDVRNQADWLAGHGYLAAAPDLFRGRAQISCMIS